MPFTQYNAFAKSPIENLIMSMMSTEKCSDYKNLRVDLHTHTTCSDGALTPKELILRATNHQIDVLAITDHDSVAGLDIAKQYIEQEQSSLTLVDGVEISTRWHNFEIHIVGLNIDTNSPELKQLLAAQQQARVERAKKIGEKLTKCGFPDIYPAAKSLAKGSSITRAHFAKAMLNAGYINHLQAAFDKYLGKGKRAYVKPGWCDIETAVKTIHQAGGNSVMAHPVRYDMTTKWLRRLVLEFKSFGGQGLEIVLPQMSNAQHQLMLSFCLEYEMKASMGSDFHYPGGWSELGKNLKMPEQVEPIWQLWK